VEVVRGPSSVAYGSDALGGVINIITREKRFSDTKPGIEGTAQIGGSSADKQMNGYLEMMPHAGRLSSVISIGGRTTDDYRAPSGTVPQSSFHDYDVMANLRYDLTPTLALKGGYQGYRGNDIGIPGLSSPVVDYGPGWTQVFNFKYYDRDAAHLALDHTYTQSWLASSMFKVYWQREKRNFFSARDLASFYYPFFGYSGPVDSHAHTDQDRLFDLNTVGAQAQFTSVKTARTRFTAGLDAVDDQTGGDNQAVTTIVDNGSGAVVGSAPTAYSQSVPTGHFANAALYAQGEWFLDPRWTLSGGARVTQYHYRADAFTPDGGVTQVAATTHDDDAVCGTLGLVYALAPDLHLSANVANGYREPNAQDLYFNGPASVGYVLGNPDLKPEKSVSYDLGLRWGPGDLAISGNAYLSTYDDLIDAINVTPPGTPPGAPNTYQYENISKARIWGGEAEANWRFRSQWELRTQLSGVVGDITSHDAIMTLYGLDESQVPLDGIPPFRGSAGLRWTTADGRTWIEPAMRYSWRYDRLPPPIAGVSQIGAAKKEWLVGDLSAGTRTPWGQRLVAGVRNIGDATYRPALSSVDEPGVSVYGTLSTDF
ncbi:MAG: TonB-dependent receptor, partial [Candidatus Eisenbacteria bacterium]